MNETRTEATNKPWWVGAQLAPRRLRVLNVATPLFRLNIFAQRIPLNPLLEISLWAPVRDGVTGKAIWHFAAWQMERC